MPTDRRGFLKLLVTLGAAPTVLSLVGCDGAVEGSDGGPPAADGGSNPTDGGSAPSDGGSAPSDGGSAPSDGGSAPSDGGATPSCSSVTNRIATNHPVPHELVVPVEHVTSGAEQTYDIRGRSAHPHMIVVTPANWETLRSTGTVMVTSSQNAGHTHVVVLTCAS